VGVSRWQAPLAHVGAKARLFIATPGRVASHFLCC